VSYNKFNDHIVVLPEDDAIRQIAVEFQRSVGIRDRFVTVEMPLGGWEKVRDRFATEWKRRLNASPKLRIVMLVDFDRDMDRRLGFEEVIGESLRNRAFVIGWPDNAEALRVSLNKSLGLIGKDAAESCVSNNPDFWQHERLRNNVDTVKQIRSEVQAFLFESVASWSTT
jgi:hypothetical protein